MKKKSKTPESWEETYFDILQRCRDEFLSANGLGGISPINKITSFDPLLHFFSQTLSTEKAKWMNEWREKIGLIKRFNHQKDCYFLQDGSYLKSHCKCGFFDYNQAIDDIIKLTTPSEQEEKK